MGKRALWHYRHYLCMRRASAASSNVSFHGAVRVSLSAVIYALSRCRLLARRHRAIPRRVMHLFLFIRARWHNISRVINVPHCIIRFQIYAAH
jgi:hypothetical protein